MNFTGHIKLMFASHTELIARHFGEISVGFALVGTFLSYLIGGWDKLIMALLILVGLDIATGCLRAFFVDKDLNSKRLREGFGTKVMYGVVIAVGQLLDTVFFAEAPILRSLAVLFYIYVEGVSILENAGNMGVPIPKRLIEGLGQVESKVGGLAKMKDGKFENDDENVG